MSIHLSVFCLLFLKVKSDWRRYIYLWMNYALFEELVTKDYERCRQVHKVCLNLIPHQQFTFAKLWTQYADFEVRFGGFLVVVVRR